MRRNTVSRFPDSRRNSRMNPAARLTLLCAATSLFVFAPANSFAQEKESKPAEKAAEKRKGRARSAALLHLVYPLRRQGCLAAPHLFRLQRRPRLSLDLAAHGL